MRAYKNKPAENEDTESPYRGPPCPRASPPSEGGNGNASSGAMAAEKPPRERTPPPSRTPPDEAPPDTGDKPNGPPASIFCRMTLPAIEMNDEVSSSRKLPKIPRAKRRKGATAPREEVLVR